MIEEVEIQEPEQQQPDPPKKKLWRKLNTDRLYTKSYKDFEQQFNTPERISKLYQSLSSQKLYTKTQPEFEQQFFQSEKKKLRGSVDFSGSSLQAGDALSQSSGEVGAEIPQIEMYKVGEDLIPTDPLSLSKKLNELSTRTKEVSMPSSGKGGQLLTSMPDEEAKKTAKKLQEDFKDLDLGGIYEETKDLSEDIVANHGKRLMSERKDNPQLYQRDLSNIKWRSGFEKQLLEYVDNGFLKPNEYNNIKHGIKQLPISTSEGDFTNQRSTIKSMADAIRLFGGDKKDDILKNFAVEVSKVYGNAYDNKFSESVKDSPESKYLNEDEQLGLQYLKDVDPDKAEQYNRILIDPKTIKDNPDAVKGANHLHQVLEETSLGLQQNAVTEELNNLYNIGKRNNGLDPEQLQRAGKLDKRQEEINQKRQELDKKYPERITSKIDDAMQEIFGQTADPIGYLHGKAVTGVAHTVQGIWESVSTPFMSDQSNTIRELSIMGERLKEDYTFHKTDKNKAIQYDELIIEPDLKAEIDAVMKNLGLSEERKRSIVNEYLKNNTDKFGRVAIHSSKFNVNPSSILYGLTDLGTSLLPFIGLEVATGGIGGAGAAAKFIRTFTAAAATTFHDEYAASIQEGKPQSEAYKRAMYTTAINSAAMAGAGTPTEVRTMLGSKSSAAKIIARLSDAEIKKVMAEGTPKGLRAIGQSLNNRAKATPTLLSQGLKTGAKFEGAMAGAAELTDREHDWKQAVLGIANFGILGAALGHFGYKSPTELQKGGLVEMGRKPKEFRATLDQMKKDGQINEAEFLHRTDLIDKAEESYKIIPKANDKGQPLDEKQKSEYLYNLVIKNEGKKEAVNLPPKQAEKAEHTSMVADYKNSHLLEEPTDKQLESRQSKLEKDLEKKDEEGKFELTDKDRKTAQAELDAIKETLEKNKKEVVEPETKPTPPTDVKVEPTNTDNVVEGSGGVVDNKTKQQLLDERLNKIKEIKDNAEGTREDRTKRYKELVNELGDETAALKKLQEEINAKAKKEIDKLPELPKTENEIINEKGENDFEKIKKDLGFKSNDYSWGKSPMDEDMGDMLLSKDKESVIFIKPNEVEVYDEKNDQTDTITNGVKIELVSTKENSRGKGKAKEMVQKVTDWADKNNTDLYLDIAPQDKSTTESGLKKLYESFGFEFDGIHGIRKPKAVEQSLKETPKADNVVEGKPTDVVVDEGVVDKSEKIEEDKDTYLSEGIQNVAKNKQASDLLKVAMNRDVIPERVYNDFGKELAAIKITPKSKTAIVEVAELIQKYSDVKNEKTDSFIKEQNQAIENADFEKRAYADMTAQEKFEAKIEDKSHTSEKLTPEELQFVNETYFAPKGYRYNENFGLVKSKKNKPEIKNEEAKVTEDTKQAEGVIKPEKNVVEDAQQTGSGKEPPKETSEQVGEEGWQNGITHAANEVRRKDRLLPEYEKEPQTFEAWNNEAEQKIKDGYDVEKLMTEIEKGKDPNPVENAIRKIYIATLDAEIAKNPTDALLAKQKRFIEIGDLANSRAGRNLVSLKGEGSPLSTISDFYVAKMEAMGVEKLTEEQKAEVKKQYDYVQKTNQEAADKIQKLEEENAKLRAEAAVRKTASSTKKQNKDYKKERQDLVQSIKDKWKNAGSDTLSSDIPYRQQLFAIAPDVAKLMKSYIEEGVTEFGEIIKRLHATIKEVEQRVTEKDVSDILSGKYDAPKETKTDLLQKLRQIKNKRSEEAVKILAKIKSGDFAKEEKAVSWVENMDLKKKFPKEYNAALDAIKVKEDARHEFDIALFRDQLSRRTTGEKITDNLSKTAGTIKAITTGIDDSAVAIQTYVSMLVRPRTGVKAFYQHIRQGFSQKKFDRWLSALHNTPDFKEMRDMGLDITEPSSLKEREKEEIFNNRFSGTIKVKGKEYKLLDAPLKPFERAFTTLGNVTRVVGYRTISKKYKNEGYTVEKDPELFKSLAKRLNTETGRGEVNEYVDMANKVVTMGIWSPKLMAQKFNILGISDLASLVLSKAGTKGYYRQLHPKERAAAIRDVAQFATTVMALSYGFAFAFGGDIDTDPLSSTFMDIKMPNGKSYNFTGGFSGYIRAISQFAMGEKHKDGKVIKIGRLETAGRFFRGKTPPLTTAGLNLAAGKNFMGEPTTVGGEIVNLAPISLRGIVSQINNDGANAFFTQGIPSFFGFNVKNEKDYRTKSQLAGEEFAKANPDLKVFIDKGISLPEYDPEKIQVEEVNGKVTEHLSDYSKETQDAYIKAHQGYYKEELTNLKNGTSLIYKDEKGTVHIDIDPQDQSGMDYVEFSKLTDDEIKYLEGQISRKVSIKTKNEIDFKNRKKKQ